MQVLPSPKFSGLIKHYLILENKTERINKLRLFSDGNTGIVFSFKQNLIIDFPSPQKPNYLPSAFVYGQVNDYKDVYSKGEIALIIVVLQPFGIKQLLGITASELKDHIIKAEDLFKWQESEIQESLFKKQDIQSRIHFIESLLAPFLYDAPALDLYVKSSLQLIVKSKGMLPVNQIAKLVDCQERQLERKFMEYVGLSPKRYSSVVKLHLLLKQIKKSRQDINLTELTYEAGYFDQSHMIREFKKITGLTPSQYLQQTDALAINFLQLTA